MLCEGGGEEESSEENLWENRFSTSNCEMNEPSACKGIQRLHSKKSINVVDRLAHREVFARPARHPRAKTERFFNGVHPKCKMPLSSLIKGIGMPEDLMHHIFMGFTQCGQYFLSYTEKVVEDMMPSYSYDYEIFLWKYSPGQILKLQSKYKIFRQYKGNLGLDKVKILQSPKDAHKIICYGLAKISPDVVYISIITVPIPPKRCKHCVGTFQKDESVNQGWCAKHGFIVHYMFPMSPPTPIFDPRVSLAFPNYFIINTGHYIHILNINTTAPTVTPPSNTLANLKDVEEKLTANYSFNDSLSEMSEEASEPFENSSIVDAILEDFNEYDLESGDCNKPFHELNISCEPLNVTGKSYHNTLVQNIVDPRLKQRLHQSNKEYLFSVPVPHSSSHASKPSEKSKIDKKNAEKAYEFTEENEKCEKLSSFRKKRLAEKKYEFSEDNSENIVPFNSLRRDRRWCRNTASRCLRSPEFNSLFLSPRSPMQSPNSRNGQFSPGGARNVYCTSIRNSPHHSKSPISPKEAARKFYVYSPSIESDCSDSDSRLILRMSHSIADKIRAASPNGLLILAPKLESPKWIKKLVRRYTNGDFENSSLVSGQSRDDYNIPIEIPLLVQNLTEQHLDVVPDYKADQITEMQLIVTQRSLDCEQFVQRRAQTLCSDAHLEFLHCVDYDIRIIYVCPVSGQVFCKAVIRIGALRSIKPYSRPDTFIAQFLFAWSAHSDAFDVIESKDNKLMPLEEFEDVGPLDMPPLSFNEVLVMDHRFDLSKTSITDSNNFYEVYLGSPTLAIFPQDVLTDEESTSDGDIISDSSDD